VTSSSVLRRSPPARDARPALLAVAIAHQARIAAERAATAREARRACAARRAAHAVACALAALERLVLADRTAELAAASRNNLLSVAGTATLRSAHGYSPGTCSPQRLASTVARPLVVARCSASARAATPRRSRVKRWASSGLLSGRSAGSSSVPT
jgi:hypothetical protein